MTTSDKEMSFEEDGSAEQINQDRGSEFAEQLNRERGKRSKARSAKPLSRLLPFILAYPRLLGAFLVCLIIASCLTLVLPVAFRLVVDCGFSVAPTAEFCRTLDLGEDLSVYFLLGILFAFLLGIFAALRFYFIGQLGERVVADLRRAVYGHLLKLDRDFYDDIRTGEVLSRLTTDTTLIQTVVGSSISIAIRTVATTLGAIILMFAVSWKLAVLVLLSGPVIIGPIIFLGRRVQRLSRLSQDRLAGASAQASESLRAIDTIQAFTREPEERKAFENAAEAAFLAALRRIRMSALLTALIFAATISGLISVLWYGAEQVQAGQMTLGTMTQFVMYAFVAVNGFGMLTETYGDIMRAAGATERIMELLEARPKITAPSNIQHLKRPVRGSINFKSVSFFYSSRPELKAIDDITFSVEPGQTVALVGPSGAGKSTVFSLLLRLYDPVSGMITFDGIPIRTIDPIELRSMLSVVQQNAPLFSGTISYNIRFGRPDASDQEVREAAVSANAMSFIEACPDGFETPLGEGGTSLSGGQKQRIAIARAILRDAPVLLLDEATSALDSESEREIQTAVSNLSADRTTLVIAHRLATVRNADEIIVLNKGRIQNRGTHKHLMKVDDLYTRYIELQYGSDPAFAVH
ncbi:MAG: ABC transporter transmembrane domain-containing protein [Pseudomonadota bacterium]